ncbi:aminoglycoside phosphotransferase [Alkalidesulfovibrio alkalitolerans DSM 16529]|jgi:aminoglycoside phosphotransferase (APT) family kinase protein|uniref:Aminoglycoside phosphotransferase n=1 Tax=Alkalidesulfovibrio alkalitolerans DSM 16529 TaxID=1121439 RepID=S7T1C6_9BACT|nr:aminoglycoside phosphotransferase family protein [Alkalidesulfovibrio alkalitolerans]EPR30336.1 aminoglycoside phosphotransferase [Alkalidesulfovibrio alkalitolerans DSM 16529]
MAAEASLPDRREAVFVFVRESGWADVSSPADVTFLAAGEYNENWFVRAPHGDLVLRINHGSQLGLGERQIVYEFNVLQALAQSGVTPRPHVVEPAPRGLPGGVLLMEYLPGRAFDYATDSDLAARIFARVHEVAPNPELVRQPDPVAAIADESLSLIERYPEHPLREKRTALLGLHARVLRLAEEARELFARDAQVLVNTEVNSGNFIVGEGERQGRAWLVDWEKAVLSTRCQDLGHFLVRTTTRWKTDYTFGPDERLRFLTTYLVESGLEEPLEELDAKVALMERTILLRALSWCYMAWHEYTRPGSRALRNPSTFARIEDYLRDIDGLAAAI